MLLEEHGDRLLWGTVQKEDLRLTEGEATLPRHIAINRTRLRCDSNVDSIRHRFKITVINYKRSQWKKWTTWKIKCLILTEREKL